MGGAVRIRRLDLTAKDLRAAAGREKNGSAARRMLALAMVHGADRKSAAESCGMDRQTLRDWVHRYNAEGLRSLHDLTTPEVPSQSSQRSSMPNWPSWLRLVPIRPVMGCCAGGVWICVTSWNDGSASCCTNARSARCWPSSATVSCRCVRAIPKPTKKPRRRLKKLRRNDRGAAPRPRQRQTDRNLVPGRGSNRPAGDANPGLGQTGNPTACAA